MRVCVLQFDDREGADENELVEQNVRYSREAGYSHEFVSRVEPLVPPYWGKVLACLGAAESGLYDAILFLDTDAAVMDFEFRVETLFGDASIFCSSGGRDDAKNAGVFAFRCPEALDLLNDWMDLYDPSRWTVADDGTWSCSGEWAGPDYEQGALNKLLSLPKYADRAKDAGWRSFMHCDHHRIDGNALCVRDFQAFVAAMRQAQIVHFCRAYSSLIPHRWKAREGRLVLFDQHATDVGVEMEMAIDLCREVPQ